MRYKILGKSGLRVSELCLGTMTFGEEWGWGASKDESKRIFDAFAGAGGNFIDTANKYTNGTSEKFVGEFMSSDRDKFVLATKYTLSMDPDDPNSSGNHRKNMVQSLEASLKRLDTEYIDLLWVHAWDPMTPVAEFMRALDDLVSAGKVFYVGISDAPAWIVSRANTLAELRGWSPFVGLQIKYNLLDRTPERDLLPMAKALDIGVTAWSPLGGGVLTGKYNRENSDPKRYGPEDPFGKMMLNDRNLSIAAKVQQIAGEIGRTPSQVALKWLLQQNDRGVVIPIIGARSATQLADNLACLEFEIEARPLQAIDSLSKIELGFPHDFLEYEEVRSTVYGNTFSLIDNHRD
ncbi:Putative oxidoreductase [Olavius sp. associated proteobacterium Delta 1]|nr:Putative oxidoreductase [Olavius sp. associated proteobacterium Delta 1]